MVRLKHRYLLVNLLYPSSNATTSDDIRLRKLPDCVQFRQPSSDQLTPQLLQSTIRNHLAHLYGDYGVGVVGSSLSG